MITQALTPPVEEISPDTKNWGEIPEPDISDIVIEDGTPVDSLLSEKQQRFLTSSIYNLKRDKPFVALSNVGLFYAQAYPPLVPDVMVSFGVRVPQDFTQKKNRSYFTWNMGKSPDVAIEIVSNKVGNELGSKLVDYARAGVSYYVVFDPLHCLGEKVLSVYQLIAGRYHLKNDYWMEEIGLGLTIWSGHFEDAEYDWLRWCDQEGNLILTGEEQAQQERQRTAQAQQQAETERQRAEQESQRAETEHQRAERLAEFLRERGINPEEI